MKKIRKQLRAIRRKLRRRLEQRRQGVAVKRNTKRVKFLKRMLGKTRRAKVRVEEAHREGVDWAYGEISPEALRAAGKDFICRYVSSDSSKSLSASESRRYSQAGIDIVLVFEDEAGAAKKGYFEGGRDARQAYDHARRMGMPDDRPVYLAVDFDAAGEGIDVRPYFRGAAAAIGRARVGIYAGLHTMQQVANDNLIDWYWQT